MTLTPPGRIMINISNILYLGEFFHSEKRSHEEQSEGWGKGISRAWLWVQIQFGLIQIRPKSLLSIIFGLGLFFPLVPLFCHCLSFLSPACPEGGRLPATRGCGYCVATFAYHGCTDNVDSVGNKVILFLCTSITPSRCKWNGFIRKVWHTPPMYVVCIVLLSA